MPSTSFRSSSFALGIALVVVAAGCARPPEREVALSTTAAGARAPSYPAPPPEAKRIVDLLDGTWKANAKVEIAGKTSEIAVTWSCEPTASRWGVTCRVTYVEPSGTAQEETHLWGWDAGGQKVHFFAVASDGSTHDHAGSFAGGDVLALEYAGAADGKPLVEKIVFTFTAAKSARLQNVVTIGGEKALTIDALFQKV